MLPGMLFLSSFKTYKICLFKLAHGYPELHKFKHLVGNFGGAWYDQNEDF